MGGATVGAGMVQAPQVQLQTPRDEEEEEHGRSQVSGRAGRLRAEGFDIAVAAEW